MIYVFECENCKKKEEIQMTLEEYKTTTVLCKNCGKQMKRDYQEEHKSGIPIFFIGKDFFINDNKKG